MDEDDYLAALRAAPGDLSLRLIFADWLDERDAPDRAWYLRVQCEQTRSLNREERFHELAREKERAMAMVGWRWCKRVVQPAVPLVDQIVVAPLERRDEVHTRRETFGLVVAEDGDEAEVVPIESAGPKPARSLRRGAVARRCRKHRFEEGYVVLGRRWWLWGWEVGPLQGELVWANRGRAGTPIQDWARELSLDEPPSLFRPS